MKPLALLPFALLVASCIPPEPPYRDQRPPMRNGEPYYPYGPGGRAPGTESGTFEPIPPAGGPATPAPQPPRNAGPQIDPYGNPDPVPVPRPAYPAAKRTANPNEVISPYAPYNVIDVEGFKSGDLAKDPSNKKIFRIP